MYNIKARINGKLYNVECSITNGFPHFEIISTKYRNL